MNDPMHGWGLLNELRKEEFLYLNIAGEEERNALSRVECINAYRYIDSFVGVVVCSFLSWREGRNA